MLNRRRQVKDLLEEVWRVELKRAREYIKGLVLVSVVGLIVCFPIRRDSTWWNVSLAVFLLGIWALQEMDYRDQK
jgi:hypothetical protein